jgi:TolA-binding protein
MKTMRIDVTKITSVKTIAALIVAALITVFAAGSLNQASAQRVPHRPRANAWTAQQSNDPKASAAFSAARDLIDDAQWAKAEAAFNQYVAQYPKEENLDAATYWSAYAEYQLKNYDKCKATIDKLLKTYEKTSWKQDAEMLLVQLPGVVTPKAATIGAGVDVAPVAAEAMTAAAAAVNANVDAVVAQSLNQAPVAISPDMQQRLAEVQERMAENQARSQERTKEAQERMQERLKDAQEKMKDKMVYRVGVGNGVGYGAGFPEEKLADDDPCEFKIVVLQSLVQSDEQRGVAAATEWLKPNSGQGPPCKRAALNVLARHGGKAALPTILSVAQSDPDIKTRARAISLLGTTNDDSVIDPLLGFVMNSTQNEITEAGMFALGQHNSPRALSALADIAISNKPLPLRKSAISSIAGRQGEPAVDALFKIYDSSQDLEVRKSVIRGLGRRKSERAGAKLLEIARSSDNVELRKEAISALGRRGGDASIDQLMNLYDSEKNEDIKTQIINSFAYSNDPKVTHKLIDIARNPQTPMERRRRIVMILGGRNKDPEVVKYFEELLRQ